MARRCRKCSKDGKRIKMPKIVFTRGIKNPRQIESPEDRRNRK